MSDDQIVELTLKGSGLSYTSSVSLRQAAEIIRIASLSATDLLSSAQTVSPATPPQAQSPQKAREMALSLPETLNLAKPSTSPETIAVISGWVMESDGAEFVTRSDIAGRYRDARLPPPANLPRDFSQAVRKGFLAPVRGSSDQFYVTQTGRALLAGKEKA